MGDGDVSCVGEGGGGRSGSFFGAETTSPTKGRETAGRAPPLPPLPIPEDWIFETARAGDYVQAAGILHLDFRFDDSEAHFSDEFVVFDELSEELIVGAKTMQAWHILLDFTTETVEYRKTAQRLRV